MGKLLETEGLKQRLSLEPGVWRHSVENAYIGWHAAQHSQKGRHLLTGPALTWAENWMMSSPETCSAGMRQFIMRSLEKQASEQALGRSEADQEDLKKESKFHWAIIGLAAFMVFSLSPQLFKGGIEVALNGPAKRIIVNKNGKATGEVIVLEKWSHVSPVATDTAPPPAVEAGVTPGVLARTEAPSPLAAPAPATLTERVLHLTALSQAQRDPADAGKSIQMALEAVELLRHNKSSEKEAAAEAAATSSLLLTLATNVPLETAKAAPANRGPLMLAGRGDRVMARTAAGGVGVWNLADGRIVTDLALEPGLALSTLRFDATWQHALAPAEDYGVSVLSIPDGRSIRTLVGHETDVVAYAFDKTGQRVMTASRDRTAKIWDAQTGAILLTLSGHDAPLTGAAFSPDGARIVTLAEDRTARIWDARDGRALATLTGHGGTVTGATFSPDARRIVTLSVDGLARIFDVAAGKLVATLEPKGSGLMQAIFSADGRSLATLDQASHIQVWNGDTGQPMAATAAPKAPVRSLVFSPDARLLAATLWNGSLAIWTAADARLLADLTPKAGNAVDARFSADGKRIVALAQNGSVESWPALDSVSAIVKVAKSKAGDCLTLAERKSLGLDGSPPHWCPASMRALGSY